MALSCAIIDLDKEIILLCVHVVMDCQKIHLLSLPKVQGILKKKISEFSIVTL